MKNETRALSSAAENPNILISTFLQDMLLAYIAVLNSSIDNIFADDVAQEVGSVIIPRSMPV